MSAKRNRWNWYTSFVTLTGDPKYMQQELQQMTMMTSCTGLALDCTPPYFIGDTIRHAFETLLNNNIRFLPIVRITISHALNKNDNAGESFASFTQLLATNQLSIGMLEVCMHTNCEQVFADLCVALENNSTVYGLTLQGDTSRCNVLALQTLLRTRTAPLSLSIQNTTAWFYHELELDIDVKSNQPALLHWTCVHNATLKMDDWPVSWTYVEGLTMDTIKFVSRSERQESNLAIWKRIISQNKIQNIHICVSNGWEAADVLHRFYQLHDWIRQSQLTPQHPLQYVHTLHIIDNPVEWDAGLLAALPQLRKLEYMIEPPDASVLPHLESLTINLWRLVRVKSLLATLRVLHVLWNTGRTVMHQAELDGLNNKILTSNVSVLFIQPHEQIIRWLCFLLVQTNCPIETLVLTNEFGTFGPFASPDSRESVMLAKAVSVNTSLRAILSNRPVNSFMQSLAQYDVARNHPRLLLVPPPECDLPPVEAMKPMRHHLQLKQVCCALHDWFLLFFMDGVFLQCVFILQRDAWQQTAFLYQCYQTLQHHPFMDACLAWLPTLRQYLGGARTAPCDLPLYEPEDVSEQLRDMWPMHTRRDCDAFWQRYPVDISAVLASDFILEKM